MYIIKKLALIILPFTLTAWLACAAEPLIHPDTKGKEWKPLFADDLSNAIKPANVWSVEDGVLTANQDQAIWTEEVYSNAIIDLEFKTADGTNSGVFVYVSDVKNWIPNSLEVQIADDFAEQWRSKPRTWQCAAIFGRLAANKSVVCKPGTWNHMTIYCKGRQVDVVLNGEHVNSIDMSKWTSAKKNPDGSVIPSFLSRPLAEFETKGRIGLQGKHASAPIWFRNLKIKPMSAEKPAKAEFYAFSNGMPAGMSYEEEAKMLSEMGYTGISQVFDKEGGQQLVERAAAYKKHGVKVLSLYLSATEKPIEPEVVAGLANGGMIEITVQEKITPAIVESIRKTAEMAAQQKIRVAVYPHAGFTVATMPQAMELVAQVDHPNFGLMFNLCHFLKSEKAEDLESILEKASPKLFAVSTHGADIDGKDWDALIQTLDKGSFPQSRLFDKLKALGFTGPVALQCYAVKGDKRENLKKSITAWKGIQTQG